MHRSVEQPDDVVREARETASIREELIRRGMATAAQLDEAGLVSHEELDLAAEEGRLEEYARRVHHGKAWGLGLLKGTTFNRNVRRGRGGKFISRLGLGPQPGPKLRLSPGRPETRAAPVRIERREEPAADTPRGPAEVSPDQLQLGQGEQMQLDEWPPRRGETARRILGRAPDTQQLHSREVDGRRVYTAERRKLHDEIIAQLIGRARPAEGRPRALFMAGGSASGKSSALTANPDMVPEGAVTIDPDAIKEMLPEYREMVADRDRYAAFAAHEESSDLAKRLRAEAVKRNLHMVVDGTGNSGKGKFAGKIKAAIRDGYDTGVLYVTVPTDIAVERSMARARRTGRYVPEQTIREVHRNVSRNAPDVIGIEGVRNVTVVDNRGEGPRVIYRRDAGRLLTMDRGLFDEFIAKGHA